MSFLLSVSTQLPETDDQGRSVEVKGVLVALVEERCC